MRPNVHAFVEDAHDIDAIVGRKVEDQMLGARINAEPLVDFIVESPSLRVLGERFEHAIQGVEISLGLLTAPGVHSVIPNAV